MSPVSGNHSFRVSFHGELCTRKIIGQLNIVRQIGVGQALTEVSVWSGKIQIGRLVEILDIGGKCVHSTWDRKRHGESPRLPQSFRDGQYHESEIPGKKKPSVDVSFPDRWGGVFRKGLGTIRYTSWTFH